MDTLTTEKRSEVMSKIRGVNTKPEMTVRRMLHRAGFRFRLHVKDLPGKPDIVLPRYRAAILVHGCFWHGHTECRGGHKPKSNVHYWSPKIDGNIRRDAEHVKRLSELGWKPIVVWECELRDTEALLSRLVTEIREGAPDRDFQ